ncbi:GNAT family N-acetyltransferase [Dermatobacter hominis]|uniref:GNAT family N-acetyltransferase n=1 Tax=Dermatobacter hominis TaxID=2884263 RepID=UPI0021053FBE|nr:GNAT family N-acetyltransferase [Dermatobacter hominis]
MTLTDRGGDAVDVQPSVDLEQSDTLRLWVPDPLDPSLTTYHTTPDTEIGDRAERFVYDTYREHGYCEESPRGWVEEVEPWRSRGTLHVICDGDEVLGVLRTIVGRFEDLPVSQFEQTEALRDGLLLDGGSLAVKSDYRGVGLATELYRNWLEVGIRAGVEGFCMLMDDGYVDVMHTLYALPTHAFAARREYMGGDIEPLVVYIDEMLEQMARVRPNLYKYAISGFTPEEIVKYDLPIILD